MNQRDTENHHDSHTLEKNQMTLSAAKNIPSQQVARSELSNPTPFIFHIIKERQKEQKSMWYWCSQFYTES